MGRIEKNLIQLKIRLSPQQHDRVSHHAKRTGLDMVDLIREAIEQRLEFLDAKEIESKRSKGRGIANVPEHQKPRGLGPRKSGSSSTTPSEPAPQRSPFDLLKTQNYVVPEKIKKAFKNFAEYVEEADGLVEIERRSKTIVEDIRQRVDEKDVQPCYEAFVEFLAARKESKEKTPTFQLDVPMVGDV